MFYKELVLIIFICMFSCKFSNKYKNKLKVIVDEEFKDNLNNWVDDIYNRPPFVRKIENGFLYLESFSDEMGVTSATNFKIDYSKDFILETRVKLKSEYPDSYLTFDFGIKKNDEAIRNVDNMEISTTYGNINFYFGYSDSKEVLVTYWDKEQETYYHRGDCEWINLEDFNVLKVIKKDKKLTFYINNKIIHSQKFERPLGKGFGFSTSPNSSVYVDYFKIEN